MSNARDNAAPRTTPPVDSRVFAGLSCLPYAIHGARRETFLAPARRNAYAASNTRHTDSPSASTSATRRQRFQTGSLPRAEPRGDARTARSPARYVETASDAYAAPAAPRTPPGHREPSPPPPHSP